MTKIFTLGDRETEATEVTATEVTAISFITLEGKEYGRQDGLLIHDSTDINRDGDGVLVGESMPDDAEEIERMLERVDLDTESETLASIKIK